MSFFRIILKVFGIALLSVFLLVFGNYAINWFERNYGNDIDFQSLKEYSNKHGLSENYAVVVDFSKSSGRHRFFVCDLKKHQVVSSSLCAHGAGKGNTVANPVFSNEVGSNCSSLGHYKITGRHKMSSTGLPSFRLKGLDSSNSNAMKRGILIHSAKLISNYRLGIYPFYLPLDKRISSGCFAVDIDMMDIVGDLVDKEKKPILLYAFNNE